MEMFQLLKIKRLLPPQKFSWNGERHILANVWLIFNILQMRRKVLIGLPLK